MMNYDMPWNLKNNENNGWLIDTEINHSSIVGGGQGRYTLNPLKKGEVVRTNPIVNIKDILLDSNKYKPGIVIEATGMDSLVKFFVPEKGDMEQLVHFAGSLGDNHIYYWTPSNYLNHSSNANLLIQRQFDQMILKTTRPIDKGEELFHDYGLHAFPSWFNRYCEKIGVLSPKTLADGLKREREIEIS